MLDTQGDKIRCDASEHLKTESAGEEISQLSRSRKENVE
jgi:hypothetical protein